MGKVKRISYKYNNETYQQKLDKLYNGQFKLIGDYIDARGHVILNCLHCGFDFEASCTSIDKNEIDEKCPNCKIKKREKEIKNIIQDMHDDIIVNKVTYVASEKYLVDYSCKKHKTKYVRLAKSMMYDYCNVWLCNECKKENIFKEKLEYVKNKFPITLKNGYVLNHINSYVENGNIYVNCVDQDGYKYSFDHKILSSVQCTKSNPCRFFKRNPYTYDNINLYCKLNKIDLYINGKGLPIACYARELLDFYDSNGNIVKTSWNHISNYKIKCKTQEETIKLKNKMYMSKEQAIPIILAKAEELKRPLLQRDFEGVETTENSVGIRVIWRLWGNFNNMIKELGLPEHDYYFKPYDKNYHPHDDVMDSVRIACNKVKSEGRTIVTYADFKKMVDIEVSTIRRHCELDNTTLNDLVRQYDCELQQAGIGMNHRFEDGEYAVSKYEYDFSNFLRKNGFEYGKTYFRNVYYKKLDDEYKGNMNCDYKINFGNIIVYVELAGILGNKEHQEAYRNNIPIKSKSKEEYRKKLNQKREIFERNNLEHYILLPDEMNEDNYKIIFKKYLKEVA